MTFLSGSSPSRNTKHDNDRLLRALRDACLAGGGIVSRAHIARRSARQASACVRRWGTWRDVLVALGDWVAVHDPDFAYRDRLPARGGTRPPTLLPRPPAPLYFGAPLNFRGLLHAPVNEAGVAMLFGILAPDLGFRIERVGASFPDCEAKRQVDGGWRRAGIEFEYESRNFQTHGHDPARCDLIVCWQHNWAAAPVEVIELKTEVARRAG